MTSVSAFNDMMGQFLCELSKAFDGEKGIKKALVQFDMLKKTNPRKCVDAYMNGISPFAGKISNRDETVFEDLSTADFLKDLSIQANWAKASENTKNCIWQYLQTLYMLATTITAIDPSMLSQIEELAAGAASKMEADGDVNQEALMKTMSNMLGGLMKNN
tara:strand:- start:2151 stop:2633 length:483 start_codon:yes stop_codon:yes gene_type:complete